MQRAGEAVRDAGEVDGGLVLITVDVLVEDPVSIGIETRQSVVVALVPAGAAFDEFAGAPVDNLPGLVGGLTSFDDPVTVLLEPLDARASVWLLDRLAPDPRSLDELLDEEDARGEGTHTAPPRPSGAAEADARAVRGERWHYSRGRRPTALRTWSR